MRLAGLLVGGVAEIFANQAIKTSFTTAPTWAGGAVGVIAALGGFIFGGKSPFIQGAAAGAGALGLAFVLNETFFSLPGISGTPQGVPNARPIPGNYLSHPVAGRRMGYRTGVNDTMQMGNLSGPETASVGALYRN